MGMTRRKLLAQGTAAAAAGLVGVASIRAEEPAAKPPMIAACGIACTTCPAMKAGKCKGCASGKDASADMVKAKNCPVLSCAAMKKIDYCGTGCKKFATCGKLVGRPYDKAFLEMIGKKLA